MVTQNLFLSLVATCFGAAQTTPPLVVSSLTHTQGPVATESLVKFIGQNITDRSVRATSPYPTALEGISISITAADNSARYARLISVSPTEVEFIVPASTPTGTAKVQLLRSGAPLESTIEIVPLAPALMSADASGTGTAFGRASLLRGDTELSNVPTFHQDSSGKPVPQTLDPGQDTDRLLVTIYASGIRNRLNLSALQVTAGEIPCELLAANPNPDFEGVDELRFLIPRSLQGAGEVDVVITVDTRIRSNTVSIAIGGVPPPPTIVSPDPVAAGFSGHLKISGTFLANASIEVIPATDTIINLSASAFRLISATIQIAAKALPGPRTLRVTTPGGTAETTFTIDPSRSPTILALTPARAKVDETIPVFVITGQNLSGAQVSFSPTDGIAFTVLSTTSTTITGRLELRQNAAGTRNVVVTTTAGRSNTMPFLVEAPPQPTRITGLIGNSTISPGETVTWELRGSGMAAISAFTCTPATGVDISLLESSLGSAKFQVTVSSEASLGKRTCRSGDYSTTMNISTFRISGEVISPSLTGRTLSLDISCNWSDPTGTVSSGPLTVREILLDLNTFTLSFATFTVNPSGRVPGAFNGRLRFTSDFSGKSSSRNYLYNFVLIASDGRESDTGSAQF